MSVLKRQMNETIAQIIYPMLVCKLSNMYRCWSVIETGSIFIVVIIFNNLRMVVDHQNADFRDIFSTAT